MKFVPFAGVFVAALIAVFFTSCIDVESFFIEPDHPAITNNTKAAESLPVTNSGIPGIYPQDSIVAKYGKLKVIRTQLCNEHETRCN